MDQQSKSIFKSPGCLVAIIAFALIVVVTDAMHSSETNFIQDVLLWIGGTVVCVALALLINHVLEKDNK